jgi:hypothetical protein
MMLFESVFEINDNHAFQSSSTEGRSRQVKHDRRERERDVWGERERNTVERENGMGHLRRWRGLI